MRLRGRIYTGALLALAGELGDLVAVPEEEHRVLQKCDRRKEGQVGEACKVLNVVVDGCTF